MSERLPKWTEHEHGRFVEGLKANGTKWKEVTKYVGSRTRK